MDLVSNKSYEISKTIFSEPEMCFNNFKENSSLKEDGCKYIFIPVNPTFTYLYDKYQRN